MAGQRDLSDRSEVKPLTFGREQIDQAIAFVRVTEVSHEQHA